MTYSIDLEPIERYGNDMVVKFWGDNGKDDLEISEAEIIAHYEVSNMLAYPIMNQNELIDGLHIPLEHYIEFCFIDGSHEYEDVKADILAYLPKVKKGGILSGHDYDRIWAGVIQAVDETLGQVEVVHGSWIYYKK
jgi:hypothetical protein